MKTQVQNSSATEAGSISIENAVMLLKKLISAPSFSGKEERAASIVAEYLSSNKVDTQRQGNNVWALNRYFDPSKPTMLLNSHLDTVRPSSAYTFDPFTSWEKEGKLYGLGSNDAGASLVCLIESFLAFYNEPGMKYNLILAATAEEENSGVNGIESILERIGNIDLALVGEPTGMQMATAQKGLMVLDCVAKGKAGHAANDDGVNAIYRAMNDIQWFENYEFGNDSELLGPVMMNVTCVQAGTLHNVIPDECKFVVDVRTTDTWTNEAVLELIRQNVYSEVLPRSMRLKPAFIDSDHSIVKAGRSLGLKTYGSPTLSDAALLNVPSLKIGPGKSERSHTADEYIRLDEMRNALKIYHQLIKKMI